VILTYSGNQCNYNNQGSKMQKMKYRLALDLGTTSLGWAMIRLNQDEQPAPIAIIKAGVRIFSDGRNPKDGSSLAVTRREARAMRRRRDRLLKRKSRMMHALTEHGFFPADLLKRKELETLNPYSLRAKGLDSALTPAEFARALFHINQRRGFKSNRKTDKKDNDSGALKTAINKLRLMLKETGCRTVGEWLNKRDLAGETVRARYRQNKVVKDDGKTRIDKSYDLYIDRAMIEAEFDALWAKQSELNALLFNKTAHDELKDCLLHQRPLKPVKPGRCTLLPDEERAPLALPSTQRFRIYQEVNNLRILREGLKEEPLTLQQRNELAVALDQNSKCTFTQIKKLLGLGGAVQFNFEDPKRQEFKGNVTNAILRKGDNFGEAWMGFDEAKQDAIVLQLVKEENESKLITWLMQETGIDERRAEAIANTGLLPGYGSLSEKALARILPKLRLDVLSYAEAAKQAGFHHSVLSANSSIPGRTFETEKVDTESGEIKTFHVHNDLPYYGEYLQRHVGFADPKAKPEDSAEKRFGKIANPTVHIGLNQVRLVVNALIKRYGHPSEVIVEIARDLKRSKELRDEDVKRQAENQRRNQRHRAAIAGILNCSEERVKGADLQKMVLWEELSFDPAFRRCPYSGVQISAAMLLSEEVEIEHILPFSQTLDDSLNNKTVAMRQANRVKGNNTPWEAFGKQTQAGFDYQAVLQRAELMPKSKRYRFAEDGLQRWLKEDKGFLARALNDTKHLSKVAREYVSLICPQNTRVIPGQMTAMLRGKFGLNDVLSLTGEKNRNDHRHHAVDACVIGVTDQGLLQRFAQASASARERQLNRLVDNMPLPWDTYREHVQRAVNNIWVSHKPDHSHEGAMHNDTAYALLGNGRVSVHKTVEGVRTRLIDNLKVIEFTSQKAGERHGLLENGALRPYKGYKGDSNYCIEIVRNGKGKWEGEVISTFEAYQLVRTEGISRLQHQSLSLSGKSLVMRLAINDNIRLEIDNSVRNLRVANMSGSGQVFMSELQEANVDTRNRDKADPFSYVSKYAGSFQKAKARRVTISPIGELRDPGFKE
jgi:CRISPR-associated endonuclease Csn1